MKELYSHLNEARDLIWERWNNVELRKEVEKYIKNIPAPLKKSPKAVLARHIATPNFEYFYFLEIAKIAKIDPVVLEYTEDKLFTFNKDKLYLVKLPFQKKSEGDHDETTLKKIVNFKESDLKKFTQIKTLWNEDLVSFHHRILSTLCSNSNTAEIFDLSSFYKKAGNELLEKYKSFISLFICHGILFEDFLIKDDEKFDKEILAPAFMDIEKRFGLRPIIVPLLPCEYERNLHWCSYPNVVSGIIDKNIKQGR